MSLPLGATVHVSASFPMRPEVRNALIALAEVAYAAVQRGLLPDESRYPPAPEKSMAPNCILPLAFIRPYPWPKKEKLPRKLKKRAKKEARRPHQLLVPQSNPSYRPFNGRLA